MKQRVAWCAVVVFPTVILVGLWATRRDLTKPNWGLPTQMATSPAYKTQSSNPLLPNLMTMQPPPEGTLAQGQRPFHYANTDSDRQRAGRELVNPFEASAETLARGQVIYETFCLVCHGASGQGDGPIIPKFPNPPNLLLEESKRLPDGEMFHVITLGRKKMASYASQVPGEDRWRVILYARSLQRGNP